MALIAVLVALLATAAGIQALAPASALALASSGTGTECFRLPGSSIAGVTANGQPCSLIEGSSGGTGVAVPPPFAGGEVIHVSGTTPPRPICTALTCLPSSGGRGGQSLEKDEGPRGGPRGAGIGSPTKGSKEEKTKRLKECRRIFRMFEDWESALIDWSTFVTELAARGRALSSLSDEEENSAFRSMKRAYDEAKRSIEFGLAASQVTNWERQGCGPVPLRWRLIHLY